MPSQEWHTFDVLKPFELTLEDRIKRSKSGPGRVDQPQIRLQKMRDEKGACYRNKGSNFLFREARIHQLMRDGFIELAS